MAESVNDTAGSDKTPWIQAGLNQQPHSAIIGTVSKFFAPSVFFMDHFRMSPRHLCWNGLVVITKIIKESCVSGGEGRETISSLQASPRKPFPWWSLHSKQQKSHKKIIFLVKAPPQKRFPRWKKRTQRRRKNWNFESNISANAVLR